MTISSRPFQRSMNISPVGEILQKGLLQGLYAGLLRGVWIKGTARVSYCLQEKLLPGLRSSWHSPPRSMCLGLD